MKKNFLSIIFLVSFFSLYAQIADEGEEILVPVESTEEMTEKIKIQKSLFFTFGPFFMLSTDDSADSAPSAMMYSLGIGGDFVFKNGISLQTHGSFFTNYYLWDGETFRIAEVENRTATALSLMLDFLGGYTFKIGVQKSHLFSIFGGAAIFVRYAVLSNGVDSDDLNRTTNSKAGDDVSSINGKFFSDLNFLYPELALSYSYLLSQTWKVGLEFRTYLPLSSLLNGDGIDGMIFSLAGKLSYK